MKIIRLIFLLLVGVLMAACSTNAVQQTELQEQTEISSQFGVDGFTLVSSAFQNQSTIPEIYTCDGQDISPPLSWDKSPAGSESLVLIMDDPDAPVGTWVHWVLFNLPANLTSLNENLDELPPGAGAGQNSWRRNDYGGPCPPGNASHHYYFKLYALDTMLDLPTGANKSDIEKAMEDHILGYAELVGIYNP